MIGDSSVGFERLEFERGFVEFGERGRVGEVAGGEGLGGGDWVVVVVVVVGGAAEDLEGESREGRRSG